MKPKMLLPIPLLIITLSTTAQITTDGTLGPRLNLPGPDYQIKPNLGQQLGDNLFHSFQEFNLQSHESASFSGPDSVNNVISRVTGGNPSVMDGLLRSTMPNADMYFLNPYGIMFGPNAKLDVQGSFHASTADYLRLQDEGQFNARQPSNSLLTVAPIEAFGFLTNTPAAITTQDSNLSVPANQTLSLIGGELRLNGESPIQFDKNNFAAAFARAKLAATGGRINLGSVASTGEVIPRESGLDLNGKGGKIRADKTLIEASGRGGGKVFIRGGQFVMENATIQANTQGDVNAKGIDMRLTESINIRGDLLAVLTDTYGRGDAGHLVIITPHFQVTGSILKASSFGQGDSGKIDIEAKQVFLKDGGRIENSTFVSGKGGDTNIKAEEIVDISGWREGNMIINGLNYINFASEIVNTTRGSGNAGSLTIVTKHLEINGGGLATDSAVVDRIEAGSAGDITINAHTANLTEGAMIFTTLRGNGQKGGNINLIITDTLSLAGQRPTSFIGPLGHDFGRMPTIISSAAFLDNQSTSQGGDIFISAGTLVIKNEGVISASSYGRPQAGNIEIKTNDLYLTQGGLISSANFIYATSDFASDLGSRRRRQTQK
jgi:filamentous hemagglutinin family protein